MLTYALAVLAACANAVSSVLQRKANKRVPQRENMSLRQIQRLLHQPVWFGGILAITAGFLLQASALGTGQLSVVEPVLVLELPFTLILASSLFRHRLGLREWLPIAAMTAGLAGLVHPRRRGLRGGDRRGRDHARPFTAAVERRFLRRGGVGRRPAARAPGAERGGHVIFPRVRVVAIPYSACSCL